MRKRAYGPLSDDEIYMRMARFFSQKSKCVSHQVGCLIVKDRRIIVNGYNGTPSGHVNCNERFKPDNFDREEHHKFSERFEIHAEMNCFLFAAREGIKIDGCTLYCTLQSCSNCLKAGVQAGVKRIVYSDLYDKCGWDDETLEFLRISGVELVHTPD
jgi:dCMP deaminase